MKVKYLILPVIFFAVILAIGGFFILARRPISLLSPATDFTPDLSEKVTKKISADFDLNIDGVKELPQLAKIPRYLVYDLDSHQVFYAKSPTEKFAPASLTKLLTVQVALDLSDPNSLITATAKSVDKEPTVLGLKPGEQLPLSDLIRGAIATSANDAAQTIADGVAAQNGLTSFAFIELMNKKASLLKMTDSRFETVDGLDNDRQFTTLVDLSKLIENVYRNYPDILAAAKSDRQDITPTATHGLYYLTNWNGLLGVYPGVEGLKIGYTEKAKHATIVTAVREGKRMVAIVSGADSYQERDLAAAALLDAGFIAVGIKPANITLYQIKKHYAVWEELIKRTRAEAEALKEQSVYNQ